MIMITGLIILLAAVIVGAAGVLSTAAKWGISKLDALRDLFNGHA
jgi:hypothetical protein